MFEEPVPMADVCVGTYYAGEFLRELLAKQSVKASPTMAQRFPFRVFHVRPPHDRRNDALDIEHSFRILVYIFITLGLFTNSSNYGFRDFCLGICLL